MRLLFGMLVLLGLLAVSFAPAGTTPPAEAAAGKQIVAYFAQWGIYQRGYRIKNIETSGSAEKITILNYAFGNVVNGECIMVTQTGVMDSFADYQKSFSAAESIDGVADNWSQALRGNFNQLRKLKQRHPHIKVLISLGGWTWSGGFSDAALTPASRERVVRSCIDIYIKGNLPVADGAGGVGAAAGVFDGIDIDWEYPADPGNGNVYRPEDTQNFTLLLAEFRRQLDAIDPNLMLTVATGAGVDKYNKLELDKIHQYLDYVNIMTYDMHGAWETKANFHAPLYGSPNDPSPYPANTYTVDNAVQGYINGGVPRNKIIVGLPFYGRGWRGVTNVNNGVYQNAAGAAPGTYEAGIEDYKVLKNLNYPSFRDPVTRAFYIYNGDIWWSYDDPAALQEKTGYINANGLAGGMVWALDGDDASGTLMSAVYNGLNNGQPPTATPPVTATSTNPPVTPTPTLPGPTATPTTPSGCNVPAWNATTVYTGGNQVSHVGKKWQAQWWTQGETPGTTGQWGVWREVGTCDGNTVTPPPPTATPVTVTSTPVTPTATPITPTATPTQGSGSCSGVPQYSAGTTYTTGQFVQNLGNKYQCTVGGWCSSSGAWAYEPGVGMYWQTAWTAAGSCGNVTTTPTVSPTSTPPTGTPTPSPTPCTTCGGSLPRHILVGYWHNFDNGSSNIKLRNIAAAWNVINVSFAEPVTPGSKTMGFTPYNATVSEFQADVQTLRGRGQKVLISIGGANAHIELMNSADAQAFSTSMINIIQTYGFDGLDIDLEGSSLALTAGDNDFRNPVSPKIVYFIQGVQQILNHFGPNFILTAAPETAFVQGGYSVYSGSYGAYLPVIYAFRNRLTYIHVQHYNSGCMLGLDGRCYSQGTADFQVAMAEMLLRGFPVAGNPVAFPALRADQVAIGLPAAPAAAGGGYTAPATVQQALNYLVKGIPYGGQYVLQNPAGYADFRGLMTWSINWDVANGQQFSNSHRPYLNSLP